MFFLFLLFPAADFMTRHSEYFQPISIDLKQPQNPKIAASSEPNFTTAMDTIIWPVLIDDLFGRDNKIKHFFYFSRPSLFRALRILIRKDAEPPKTYRPIIRFDVGVTL